MKRKSKAKIIKRSTKKITTRRKILKNLSKRPRKNPLTSLLITEYFNLPTLTDFKHPQITKTEYFKLGVNLGFANGIRLKNNEDKRNDIRAFYQQEASNFTGLANKNNLEAFEFGVIVGLQTGIDTDGDDERATMKYIQEFNSILNRYKIGVKKQENKKIVTPYEF